MSASPRQSQVRVAVAAGFAPQSGFGTATANGDIDTLVSLTDEEPTLDIVTKDEEIVHCSGQYLIDEIVLARASRLGFQAEAQTLFDLFGITLGTVVDDTITMLGVDEFQPPPISIIWGHGGSGNTKLKFKDMVVDELRVRGRINERLKGSVVFRGNGAPTSETYTFPECSAVTPIYLKDCAFSVNSVSKLADTREFELFYSNKLLADEDPFTMASQDVQRMERDDRRDHFLDYTVYGQPGDATHTAALAKTKYPVSLRLGPASDGVLIAAASAILKQNGSPTHDGQARRSVLKLRLVPRKIDGDDETPLVITRLTA